MAKEPVTTRADRQAVAHLEQGGNVPAFLAEKANEDAGKGLSRDQADNIVPLVYILQAQSPQCVKRSPDYIEGAEAGALWLRNSGIPPINGEDGFLFQPCFFSKDWVEWKPNRGGYAGRHDTRPADAVEKTVQTDKGEAVRWVRENGNIVQETRYHIGIVIFDDGRTMPYVIPMVGSNHTVSRTWMTMMNSKNLGDGVAPSFACLYRVGTKFATNDQGDWYKYDIVDAGWVQTAKDYERGRALHEAFATGEKIAEAPMDEAAGTGGATGGGDNAAM